MARASRPGSGPSNTSVFKAQRPHRHGPSPLADLAPPRPAPRRQPGPCGGSGKHRRRDRRVRVGSGDPGTCPWPAQGGASAAVVLERKPQGIGTPLGASRQPAGDPAGQAQRPAPPAGGGHRRRGGDLEQGWGALCPGEGSGRGGSPAGPGHQGVGGLGPAADPTGPAQNRQRRSLPGVWPLLAQLARPGGTALGRGSPQLKPGARGPAGSRWSHPGITRPSWPAPAAPGERQP